MKLKVHNHTQNNFNIFIKSVFFIFFFLLMGCSNPYGSADNSNKVAYYNFKDSDTEKLLPYLLNQQIVFKNQLGEERIFQIFSVSKYYKNSYTVGMGFFTSYAAKYFDYDEKKIYFNNSICGGFEINFLRWPNDTELAKSNIKYEYPSSFSGHINNFPYWNGIPNPNYYSSTISIYYPSNKISMTSNGIIYNNVIKIESNNNTSLTSSDPNCPKNVNIIYYDTKKGIIGFDDLDNKNWRLQ